MHDTTPQTAAGKMLWHFSMSLDGFVAGPDQSRSPRLPVPKKGTPLCTSASSLNSSSL